MRLISNNMKKVCLNSKSANDSEIHLKFSLVLLLYVLKSEITFEFMV